MTKRLKDPQKINEAYLKVKEGLESGTFKTLKEAYTATGISPNMYYTRLKKEKRGDTTPSIQQLSISGSNHHLLLITSDQDLIQKVLARFT